MTLLDRRQALALIAALPSTGLAAVDQDTTAAAWPERTVRIVCPLTPGGPNDVSARLIGQRLQERFHFPFVIENRPGAATRIGNAIVSRAAPDGTTLLYASAALAILPSLYSNLPYDWRVNLSPITLAAIAPLFLVVNDQSPARDVDEFIVMAQKRPLGLTFAGPGVATVPHLVTELFMRKVRVAGRTVHFNGDAGATFELLADRVDATFTTLTSSLSYIQRGKLRVLAVASRQRSSIYPAAPTFLERGIDDVSGSAWFGFLSPVGLHPNMIGAIHEAIADVLADPRVTVAMAEAGLQAMGSSTPKEFSTFIAAEVRKWSGVIKDANITVE
jgi:tripartite-type tricarboxylate transporter receptor subunit TctC